MANTISRREALGAAVALVSTPLVAPAGERKTVADRIAAFIETKRALDHAVRVHEDDAFEMPVWPTFEEAERALVEHPCADDGERRMKVLFALNDPYFLDTIENNTRGDVPVLVDFLRSLV